MGAAAHPDADVREQPRRAAGVVVLLLAAAVLLSVPTLFDRGIDGIAARRAFVPPPTVGACADMRSGTAVVVECTATHDAEVMLSWSSWRRPPVSSFTVDGAPIRQEPQPLGFPTVPSDQLDPCWDAYLDYVPSASQTPDADGWILQRPQLTVVLARSPVTTEPDDAWFGCLVAQPDGAAYPGTVRTLFPASATWPAAVGNCFAPTADEASTMVSCAASHRIERLAYWGGDRSAAGADLAEHCATLAASVLRTADPTYGGRLAIAVDGIPRDAITPDCFVELVGDGALTGSVVGLGDGPLPTG